MKRSEAIRQLEQVLSTDPFDEGNRDDLPPTDEASDIHGYSVDMLTEECRLHGLISESQIVVEDGDEEEADDEGLPPAA